MGKRHTETQTAAESAEFDPDAFLVVPARTFEDLRIGEVFRAPSRTLTDAHAAAFQTVSADNHPVHYDTEWARKYGHPAPVVHGLQVLAFTAPGPPCSRTSSVRCSSDSWKCRAPS
ncbi:MaoC family dehydratase [Streptomyces sp. NPDC059928]|uniref:MaoC family dehydratase n=1 Tax=unclassified Streptomyces TaxID=2593676 RepID=UPI00365BD165